MDNACRYCHWFVNRLSGPWGVLRQMQATKLCDKFEREPGSDDE